MGGQEFIGGSKLHFVLDHLGGILDYFRPFLVILNNFCAFSTILGHLGPFLSIMDHSGALWIIMWHLLWMLLVSGEIIFLGERFLLGCQVTT